MLFLLYLYLLKVYLKYKVIYGFLLMKIRKYFKQFTYLINWLIKLKRKTLNNIILYLFLLRKIYTFSFPLPSNQCPLPDDEYLKPNITANIIIVLIKQIIHLAACLLSAFLSTFSKCSLAFSTWLKVSSILKSILSISDPWWITS